MAPIRTREQALGRSPDDGPTRSNPLLWVIVLRWVIALIAALVTLVYVSDVVR